MVKKILFLCVLSIGLFLSVLAKADDTTDTTTICQPSQDPNIPDNCKKEDEAQKRLETIENYFAAASNASAASTTTSSNDQSGTTNNTPEFTMKLPPIVKLPNMPSPVINIADTINAGTPPSPQNTQQPRSIYQ